MTSIVLVERKALPFSLPQTCKNNGKLTYHYAEQEDGIETTMGVKLLLVKLVLVGFKFALELRQYELVVPPVRGS